MAAEAAAAADTTMRLESWQPLAGLESLEAVLRSVAGSTALVVTLGLEARKIYAHGAQFEGESCLTPLLAALPCVLSITAHIRAAGETAGAVPAGGGGDGGVLKQVPVAHQLAKMVAELTNPGSARGRNAAVHQFNSFMDMVGRNRQSFVLLVEYALVKVRPCVLFPFVI